MNTTERRAVPLGVPTVVGLGGLAAVVAADGQAWHIVVSAVLGAVLVITDIARAARKRSA